MDQKDILEALRKVKHPETGNDIVSQGNGRKSGGKRL